MIISFSNRSNLQYDINVVINGQWQDISKEEKEKIEELFQKYKESDITIKLIKCNRTYIDSINEVIKIMDRKTIIVVERENNEEYSIENQIEIPRQHIEVVVIKSEEDYQKYINLTYCQNNIEINQQVLIDHVEEINGNDKITNIILSIKDISLLTPKLLTKLVSSSKIIGIEFKWENIIGHHCRNLLTVKEYLKVYNILDGYRNIANREKSTIKKFMTAYYLIGKNIEYDFDEDGETSRVGTAHSIKGAVIRKRATCEGYAEALSQLLNMLNIENKCVTGKESYGGGHSKHVWNQVKIKGIWYNCDITNDSVNIQEGRNCDYCLVSDEEILFYESISHNAERCPRSYRTKNLLLGKER